MQMLEGHLAETLRANVDLLQHVQIAGVPGRHEPDVGEIHYPFLFDLLDEIGYRGWVVRIPPAGAHPGRTGLGAALWDHATGSLNAPVPEGGEL